MSTQPNPPSHNPSHNQTSNLAETIANNLVHQQLWTETVVLPTAEYALCRGKPPQKLALEDEDIQTEYVACAHLCHSWSIKKCAEVFDLVKRFENLKEEPKRIILAVLAQDSTIVYYTLHNGLKPPRQ